MKDFDFNDIRTKVRKKYDNIIFDGIGGIGYIDPTNGLKTSIDCNFGYLRKIVGPYGPKNNRYKIYEINGEDDI